MRSKFVLLLLGIAGTAWAKGEKPAIDPAHFADESTVFFQVMQGSDGYWVQAGAEAIGIEKDDEVRLEVRQGAKVLKTIKCDDQWANEELKLSRLNCGAYTDGELKVAGAITADLILKADKDDKEYLLRTFNVNVKKWDNQVWQIDPDDLLGPGYVAARPHQSGSIQPEFRFWIANAVSGGSPILRCKVDGKSIPEITASMQDRKTIDVDIIKGNNRTRWHWAQVFVTGNNFYWDKDGSGAKMSFAEHPGSWDCELRMNGAMIRGFKFSVDDKGNVPPHAMQSAKGAAPLGPRVSQIDMTIGAGNGIDQRIKPDLIKKSRGYGMPWPQHDSVKQLLGALPPAFENQAPVVVKKGKGKLIDGLAASPQRFIDESSASVRIQRSMEGYSIYSEQAVANVSQSRGNTYRLEWKQGGKLVATAKCEWNQTQEDDRVAAFGMKDAVWVSCHYDDKPVTAKGAVEASLIMSDDSDGNEYIVRTYKVNVVKFTSFGDPVWQIVPDDVLATAWIKQPLGGAWVSFRFWIASDAPHNLKLRCTVGGKKVPDFKLGQQTDDPSIVAETHTKTGGSTKYAWQWVSGGVSSPDVAPGLPQKDFKPDPDRLQYIGEYPGAWDCDVRDGTKVIRKLLFTVNAKGYVDPDPAQTGPQAPTFPNVVPLDLRFGKDAKDVDWRIRPDAMKKSRGFGLPWPKAPSKPFPPASGLPDPK